MKPIDVKSTSYAEYNVDSNEKYPKFQVDDHVRIKKYKSIFAKEYAISKIKNTVPWAYVITDLNTKKLLELFVKKNCRRLIKKNLE